MKLYLETYNFIIEQSKIDNNYICHYDLDLNEPVYNSLKNLWDRILPGGYIIFDEYEYHKFDESNGVDSFLHLFTFQTPIIFVK